MKKIKNVLFVSAVLLGTIGMTGCEEGGCYELNDHLVCMPR